MGFLPSPSPLSRLKCLPKLPFSSCSFLFVPKIFFLLLLRLLLPLLLQITFFKLFLLFSRNKLFKPLSSCSPFYPFPKITFSRRFVYIFFPSSFPYSAPKVTSSSSLPSPQDYFFFPSCFLILYLFPQNTFFKLYLFFLLLFLFLPHITFFKLFLYLFDFLHNSLLAIFFLLFFRDLVDSRLWGRRHGRFGVGSIAFRICEAEGVRRR